jgi:hypothetical protein
MGPKGSSVPNAKRSTVIVAVGWVSLAACGSSPQSGPNASGPGSASLSTTAPESTTIPQSTLMPRSTTTATPCIGLSICTPPPPDAQGNPACYYADGWEPDASGTGINVWYFHEPQNMSKPDRVTVVIRQNNGPDASQVADIAPGQQVHHFEFPSIDKSAVQEVLLDSNTGRCFVIGPDGR